VGEKRVCFNIQDSLADQISVCFNFTRPQVLITKLRSANTAETKQYRKASKALLVLIPLFGLTYLIVLYGPAEGIGKKIFDFARAFLLSTQVRGEIMKHNNIIIISGIH
jgi:hypothetical protein